MHARSALFDLYGDHLRARGGSAPVAALVRLLAPLGISPPAVRTAVSRMVRQGWLEPVRLTQGGGYSPGYALTPRAVRRLDEAAQRIYRGSEPAWEGTWHLVLTSPGAGRSTRERLRSALSFLGYAPLGDGAWISPRASAELDALLEAEGVRAERFTATSDGHGAGLVRRAWDLEELSRAYLRWLDEAQDLLGRPGPPPDDEEAFAMRFRLVHEWRKFLFRDPDLPAMLLPENWPGNTARAYFDAHARRLSPAADRFVDGCLRTPPTS